MGTSNGEYMKTGAGACIYVFFGVCVRCPLAVLFHNHEPRTSSPNYQYTETLGWPCADGDEYFLCKCIV